MRIATWNVNSIRTRVDLVIDFLKRADIDVLAMQEIKCKPEQFPVEKFTQAGYELQIYGLNQWNGVAFASRYPMSEIATVFPNQPGFGKPIKGQEGVQQNGPNGLPQEARALGVTVNDVRLWSLYVPNGRELQDPHFEYKLNWLHTLQENAQNWLTENPELPLALMGDWNVAPFDKDMGDPSFIPGVSTHISPEERKAFLSFNETLTDVVRPYQPEGFTYWDYRMGKFERNQGMRIDFILGSEAFNNAVTNAFIARDERIERTDIKPSDHVPVVCDLDLELLQQDVDALADDPLFW